jgi:hypothetical protein
MLIDKQTGVTELRTSPSPGYSVNKQSLFLLELRMEINPTDDAETFSGSFSIDGLEMCSAPHCRLPASVQADHEIAFM